jgi:lysophospholipase L1-like esterase/phosphoserine phosphatase
MAIHSDNERADEHRAAGSNASGGSLLLPVAALSALLGAVLWFGLMPAPTVLRQPVVPPAVSAAAAVAARPAAGGAVAPVASAVAVDPLPSWSDGPTKQRILEFIDAVSRPGGEAFVPVPERVAVFDNDGTLVCEKPIAHGMFLIDRVRDLVQREPDIAHEEPFATLLTGDIEFVRRLGKKYMLDATCAALAGEPEERLEAAARRFLEEARHPVFGVPYGDVTYQPMKELIALLRSREFSVWICSGSGVHFMRPAAEAWYGVGPEHVIASRPAAEIRETAAAAVGSEDAAKERLELVTLPQLHVLNDEARKPVSIAEHVGRRPIFAAGNVGTTGDIEMLRWSQSGPRRSLQLLVLHDDADREMAYGEPSNDSLEAAERYGWTVVRMAQDWKQIFARPLEKQAAVAASPAAAAPAQPPAAVPAEQMVAASPGRWEEQVAEIERADRESPPVPGGVVFLGSSNIRLWTTLAEDFAGLAAINRGVGGARLAELPAVASRLVAAARPAAVVVSAGTNDIANGASPADVRAAFAELVERLREAVPGVRIAFLAIAPSKLRWEQRERQQVANEAVRDYIASQGSDAGLAYFDANAAFLDNQGEPAVECFLDDQQHPSTIGNARRAALLRPLIEDFLR